MRQLWHVPVSVQLDNIVRLKTEAKRDVETAQSVMAELNLRGLLVTRDVELAQARTDLAVRKR